MRGKNQSKEIAVRGKEVFVEIDVHKESWPGRSGKDGFVKMKVLLRYTGICLKCDPN